jgi:hypothetical protein
MSWRGALIWGTVIVAVIVAVLLGVLAGAHFFIQSFMFGL